MTTLGQKGYRKVTKQRENLTIANLRYAVFCDFNYRPAKNGNGILTFSARWQIKNRVLSIRLCRFTAIKLLLEEFLEKY